MPGTLDGRVAVVTGASAGIGRAVTLALAREGATVFAAARRAEELRSLAGASQGGRTIRWLAGDVTDGAFVASLAERVSEADILVNNAGMLTYAPALELTAAECETMFRLNVLAAIDVSQRFGASMAARGQGHIVVMTSTAARSVGPLRSVYSATKHALAAFTQGLRMELKGRGVKVTEIAPGMVDTGIRNGNTHPAATALFQGMNFAPMTADDVAQAVLYAVTTSATCCPDLIELRPPQA